MFKKINYKIKTSKTIEGKIILESSSKNNPDYGFSLESGSRKSLEKHVEDINELDGKIEKDKKNTLK